MRREKSTFSNIFIVAAILLLTFPFVVTFSEAMTRVFEKFYFFDPGVYRAIRPNGPLDIDEEIGGVAMESLVLSQLMANNDLLKLDYEIGYYRTATGVEVDFILLTTRR